MEPEGRGRPASLRLFCVRTLSEREAVQGQAGGGGDLPLPDQGSMIPALLQSCATWGNNILCENVDYKHLINISKIALPLDVQVPDAAELFKD